MATEIKQIIIRRGLASETPALAEGELGLQTDTSNLLLGTSGGNVILSKVGHSHDDLYYTEGQVDTFLATKQDTLVSDTNIKTVNSTSLLGSGDVAVQPTLVSGTNIKTINNVSILGSGNIEVTGTGGTSLETNSQVTLFAGSQAIANTATQVFTLPVTEIRNTKVSVFYNVFGGNTTGSVVLDDTGAGTLSGANITISSTTSGFSITNNTGVTITILKIRLFLNTEAV